MKVVILLLTMMMTLSVNGQSYQSGRKQKTEQRLTLTKKQKEEISKSVIAKVKRFQENCRLIGSKDKTYEEKTCKGGYIDVAMQDFLDDAIIEITSIDGKSSTRKTVKRYLLNLSLLKYKEINIKSYNYAILSDIEKDVNKSRETGQVWYYCTATVYQTFNATTHEGRIVQDTVVRTFKVYIHENKIYGSNGSVEVYYDVKLENISAKNV